MASSIVPGIYHEARARPEARHRHRRRLRHGLPARARGGAAGRPVVRRGARGGARRWRARCSEGTIVVLFPDFGDRYLSTNLWLGWTEARVSEARRHGPAARAGGAETRAKLYLTYPKPLVREPLIYQMSRKFDLVFNIRSASVSEEIGIIAHRARRRRGRHRARPSRGCASGRHRRADREERHRVMLSDAQIERWSRQILLPEVGGRGQERLLAARVGRASAAGPGADGAVDLLAPRGCRRSCAAACRRTSTWPSTCDGDGGAARVAPGTPLVRGGRRRRGSTSLTLVGRPCAAVRSPWSPPSTVDRRRSLAPAAAARSARSRPARRCASLLVASGGRTRCTARPRDADASPASALARRRLRRLRGSRA